VISLFNRAFGGFMVFYVGAVVLVLLFCGVREARKAYRWVRFHCGRVRAEAGAAEPGRGASPPDHQAGLSPMDARTRVPADGGFVNGILTWVLGTIGLWLVVAFLVAVAAGKWLRERRLDREARERQYQQAGMLEDPVAAVAYFNSLREVESNGRHP